MINEDMNGEVRYIDPTKRGYVEYFDHLIAYNQTIHGMVSRGLQTMLKGLPVCSILTTGSDARLEKGPESSIELMILVDDLPKAREILPLLKKRVSEMVYPTPVDPGIEVKDVAHGTMSQSIFQRDSESPIVIVSPNRLFDAVPLYGDPNLYLEARARLEAELISAGGKKILKKISDKTKQHRRIACTGKQVYRGEELTHFDLDSGISYYDPEKRVWSFKQGPIRAVQFAIARDKIRRIRSGDADSFSMDWPANIVQQANAFEVQGLTALSEQQVRDVTDCYKYFVWQYHQSQAAYREKGLKQIGFNASEVRERCKTIDEICQQEILKIKEE